jgi:hypothetical protein
MPELLPITLIAQHDIAARTPDIHSQHRERGVRMNELVVAIKLEILFQARLRVLFLRALQGQVLGCSG